MHDPDSVVGLCTENTSRERERERIVSDKLLDVSVVFVMVLGNRQNVCQISSILKFVKIMDTCCEP